MFACVYVHDRPLLFYTPFCINKLHNHALHALNSDLLTYPVSWWYKAQKHIPMQELCTYTCTAHIPVPLEAPQNCKNPFTLVGHPFSSATCICEAQNALPDVTGSQGHTSGSLTLGPSIVYSTGNVQCGKTSFQLPSSDQQWPHPEWNFNDITSRLKLHIISYSMKRAWVINYLFITSWRGRVRIVMSVPVQQLLSWTHRYHYLS